MSRFVSALSITWEIIWRAALFFIVWALLLAMFFVPFGSGFGKWHDASPLTAQLYSDFVSAATILTDGCTNFLKFLVEGTKPNLKKIKEYVDRSLMLVTALSPVIGYDKASKIAHHAMENDLTLKEAALELGFVSAEEFDRVVDPLKMVHPYVAK